MVKAYLRYVPGRTFGVVASTGANLVADVTGRLAIAPALQDVIVWDCKKAEPVMTWRDDENKAEVTCIARTRQGNHFAVGYNDGSIRVWTMRSSTTPHVIFRGHKGAVTALAFDSAGTTLASGSADTEIVLWDIVGEAGKARLKGHKDQITSLVFVPSGAALQQRAESLDVDRKHDRQLHRHLADLPPAHLLSASKDTTIKAWDLATNACVETVVTHRSEVWAMTVTQMWQDPPETLTLVSAGEEIKVHKVNAAHLDQILSTTTSTTTDAQPPSASADGDVAMLDEPTRAITFHGDLKKVSSQRAVSLRFSACHRYLVAATTSSRRVPGTNLVKVWNVRTGTCIRSMESGYSLSVAFVPGGKYLLVGTKSGQLQIFSIATSSLVETIDAHEGAIWSIYLTPDKTGFVTGSADKQVKFWDFALIKEEANRLTAIHTRTLKLSDEVLSVVISPNQQLLAVSLLDATVKVFHYDSLKFSLSLYGHKLPVLCMDISSDNTLIVTGSADKNLKVWGLDFGDCHRSLFAHSDSIMAVKFVWGTHYVFSCSKDRSIKYWDMDKFENITTLQGHLSEVWALAVAKHGSFILSGSHDRSLRVWEKTDEQLFLVEEREREMDEAADETLLEAANDAADGADDVAQATAESLKAGERILEALELAKDERERIAEHKLSGEPFTPNIILQAMNMPDPETYVLSTIEKIRSADLEAALLVIPFSWIPLLLELTNHWAEREWNLAVTCRVLFFLLKVHHHQITASRALRPSLVNLQAHVRKALERQRDVIGRNMAAFRYLKREKELLSTTTF
ncbi:hypothetical protein AMAG_06385 [Allomyces macrogynus ATCC 38327]|uniref:Small-subunit processome Utp12 domain-containing protein n=1 Tax=Allomyces macrogynus (strain ATCC 38327) TaxID=578462 RepID=A0A0L0SGJ6_ALLM3|nr:hypothetical protein AMAG_06385 [Allomyces macrogynus ATCC 38327]|eukprot:KNE61569.1 hypothetical protein AMAG_06385 [Allomyces macrogynus ATCC 38327]